MVAANLFPTPERAQFVFLIVRRLTRASRSPQSGPGTLTARPLINWPATHYLVRFHYPFRCFCLKHMVTVEVHGVRFLSTSFFGLLFYVTVWFYHQIEKYTTFERSEIISSSVTVPHS